MTIDLTELITAIVRIVFSAICIYIMPNIRTWLKNKTDELSREKIKQAVATVVSATEQIYKSYSESDKGAAKKAYAMDVLQKMNLSVDVDILSTMIEDEVYKLNNSL